MTELQLEQRVEETPPFKVVYDLAIAALDSLSRDDTRRAEEQAAKAIYELPKAKKAIMAQNGEERGFWETQKLEALVTAADHLSIARLLYEQGSKDFDTALLASLPLGKDHRTGLEDAFKHYKKAAAEISKWRELVTEPSEQEQTALKQGLSQLFPRWWATCFFLGADSDLTGLETLKEAAALEKAPGSDYKSKVTQSLKHFADAMKWYHNEMGVFTRAGREGAETPEGVKAKLQNLQSEINGLAYQAIELAIMTGERKIAKKLKKVAIKYDVPEKYMPKLYRRKPQAMYKSTVYGQKEDSRNSGPPLR
ncbi:hypothetical protein HYV85_06315 [Candidatus Woesearchaeota archaeon]|nr:hypothetical protein [Candidatus Woesearchaeota archaeon]